MWSLLLYFIAPYMLFTFIDRGIPKFSFTLNQIEHKNEDASKEIEINKTIELNKTIVSQHLNEIKNNSVGGRDGDWSVAGNKRERESDMQAAR